MNKSEEINELTKALIKFQSEVSGVEMNATNPFYKSKYADLITIIKTCKPVLVKNGLAFTQFVDHDESGGCIKTVLMHESGQYISSNTHYNITGKPQEQGSAITYMRRYSLSAILGIAADPDDDGEIAQNIQPASVLEGGIEEEVRSKGGDYKDKGESKAIYHKYVAEFEKFKNMKATEANREALKSLLNELKAAWGKLLNYEKAKLKPLKDQLVNDFELGE